MWAYLLCRAYKVIYTVNQNSYWERISPIVFSLNTLKCIWGQWKEPWLSEQATRLAHMIWLLLLQLLDFGCESEVNLRSSKLKYLSWVAWIYVCMYIQWLQFIKKSATKSEKPLKQMWTTRHVSQLLVWMLS